MAPDGTIYTNRFDYLEMTSDERLVIAPRADIADDPLACGVTVSPDRTMTARPF